MGPYHDGELEVQRRAGVASTAERVGRIVQHQIPDVARHFIAQQRFAILGAADHEGRVWASLLLGKPGFLSAPTDGLLHVAAHPSPEDPLASGLDAELDVGLLVIEPATRRRMRVNGRARPAGPGAFEVATREVYSNCPKYIHSREVRLASEGDAPSVRLERAPRLTDRQAALIRAADTLFIATRHAEAGADASHRGGAPGFVRVVAPDRLLIPDYVGNAMFNSLGNIAADPRAGLLLVDFDTGSTLQLTGRAAIEWSPEHLSELPGALRAVDFEIEEVRQREPRIMEGRSILAAGGTPCAQRSSPEPADPR
jgi:predicted pyridoxine 5'-phosphate oxidase superfamily flavin-nucleotide-binding protein